MGQKHVEVQVPGSKQDAVLWDEPNGKIYNVHVEGDWAYIRNRKPLLKCPVKRCGVKLVAVDRQGTRHFRNAAGSIDCRHFTARSADHSTRGGGPMSDEHLWYQQEIAKQVSKRPHMQAIVEDYESNADVLIFNHDTNRSLAVEIQRWDTNIFKRTEHRLSLGHEVIWLITDSAQLSPEMLRQVYLGRGAFIRVRTFEKPYGTLTPWEPGAPRSVPVMEVSGTIARLDESSGTLRATRLPLMRVVDEILDGKRNWLFPGREVFKNSSGAGRTGGSWVRNIDYTNTLIRSSGLKIPPLEETSHYGRRSAPIVLPPAYPEGLAGDGST
ncbi:hypothetical protein FBY33_2062 [Arthrobacter sp. SLBN-112]|uniref:hypothetical protein n=1 Tax=Arthrobacter sp. SLBN-112 TaxID=2768452 RepID=UPI00115448C5|nr:hypothetical protein [Arthrobacter sp. SLBN-112]TQJ40022.1 hypothetical protein FBY33_2062 [Arthrobacter sp. SLBN-112]